MANNSARHDGQVSRYGIAVDSAPGTKEAMPRLQEVDLILVA
jgi:hypothetical protein